MFYDHPIWAFTMLVLTAPALTFILAGIRRRSQVRGTHARFVSNTTMRMTMYPAVAFWAMNALEDVGNQKPFGAVVSLAMLAITLHDIKKFRDDDEDDWFTGRAAKVKKWLRDKATSLAAKASSGLTPHPSPA